jgi:hypothetical protein
VKQVYGFITTAANISDASTVAGPFIIDLDTQNNTSSGSAQSGGSNAAKQTSSALSAVAVSIPASLLAVAGALAYLA